MSAHDPNLCFCGADRCCCPCERCQQQRDSEDHWARLQAIEQRLKKSGIEPDDLADLLFYRIEARLEQAVRTLAREELRAALEDLSLVSRVRWSTAHE